MGVVVNRLAHVHPVLPVVGADDPAVAQCATHVEVVLVLEVGGQRSLVGPELVHLDAGVLARVGGERIGEAARFGPPGCLKWCADLDRLVTVGLVREIDGAGDDDHAGSLAHVWHDLGMHAALITGKETVELVEVPDPVPAVDGVVVDIQLCGICGTDIHAWQSGDPYNPAICGHEWTGLVSAVGADVRAFSEGDRVVCTVPPACGRCEPCIAGQTSWCQSTMLVAVGRDPHAQPHGGFASQIAAHQGRVLHVNPALSVEQAAQVEPATVGFHAVRQTQPRLGDIVVVQGAGPIGLVTLQAALAGGAGEVIVVEPNEARRGLASELGATHAVGLDVADAFIKERTRGLGADLVYECVGRPETIQQAVDRSRRGGRVCLIGLPIGQATINPAVWLVKEVQFSGALAYTHDDFERCMGMIADGRLQLDPMHSSTVTVDGLHDAIADLASGTSTETKVLVSPT